MPVVERPERYMRCRIMRTFCKILFIAVTAVLIRGQNGNQMEALQFEVASVKPSPPQGAGLRVGVIGGPGTTSPELFRCDNCSLETLICTALEISSFQYLGPEWTKSAYFVVSARLKKDSTKSEFHIMLRNLLIERFGFKAHTDHRQLPGYDLLINKGGPKFREARDDSPEENIPLSGGKPKLDENGYPVLPAGRGGMLVMYSDRATLRCSRISMEELAARLSAEVGEPVTDRTDLKGKYDFLLRWHQQVPGTAPADDPTAPTIFESVKNQLGLKLEAKKEKIKVVIVDHIERSPTAN